VGVVADIRMGTGWEVPVATSRVLVADGNWVTASVLVAVGSDRCVGVGVAVWVGLSVGLDVDVGVSVGSAAGCSVGLAQEARKRIKTSTTRNRVAFLIALILSITQSFYPAY